MAGTQRVSTGYVARSQFIPLHTRKERYAIAVCHRRAGKTVACVMDLLDAALRCKLPEPRYAYLAPFYSQAKDVAWGYLKRFAMVIPGAVPHEGELRVDLPNKGRVRLYGADNYDRLRGIYLDGVVLDEYGDMDPRAWPEVIRPALSDRKGWAMFIGTPKGRNHFSDLWDLATGREKADWFSLMLKASETGLLSLDELADARKTMTEDQYDAEFECSFQAAVVGAYFGKEMSNAEKEKRICGVPWQPEIKVHTAWDLGVGDDTAIWFAQIVGKEIHVIDYLENRGVGADWYAKALKAKPYTYGDHFWPHDAQGREFGSGGKAIAEVLSNLGVEGVVQKQRDKEDSINAARMLLPRCWFDADKCEKGIQALRNYRREYDEKRKVYADRPYHDWSSHAADAFMELAAADLTGGDSFMRRLDYSNINKAII